MHLLLTNLQKIFTCAKEIKYIKIKIQVDFVLLMIDLALVDFVNLLVSSVKLIAPYPPTFCFLVSV